MDDRIVALAETLSCQSSLDDLWPVVCEGLADIGLPEISWGHVDPGNDPPSGTAVRSTLPNTLWADYYREGHFKCDPVVLHFLATDEPFIDHYGWHDVSLLPRAKQEFAGLIMGVCLPARFAVAERSLGRTKIGILSLAADVSAETWRAHAERNLVAFTLAARMCAAYLASAEPPTTGQKLSARETECLTLLARGDRNDRIAQKLGLHRATVDMHIVRARRKLRAKTREQAIAKAVAGGAITP